MTLLMENTTAQCIAILSVYIIIISIIAVWITVSDKKAAKRHKWRVPESTLIFISAVGGSVAMYITMKAIHHKTKHPKFMVGIPVIIVLQILTAAALKYFAVI